MRRRHAGGVKRNSGVRGSVEDSQVRGLLQHQQLLADGHFSGGESHHKLYRNAAIRCRPMLDELPRVDHPICVGDKSTRKVLRRCCVSRGSHQQRARQTTAPTLGTFNDPDEDRRTKNTATQVQTRTAAAAPAASGLHLRERGEVTRATSIPDDAGAAPTGSANMGFCCMVPAGQGSVWGGVGSIISVAVIQ